MRVRLVDVRLLEVVDVPVGVPLAHGVGAGLDRAFALERALGAGPVGQAEGGDVLLVVGVGQLASRFEDRDAETRFRQALGHPPARRAGADDYDVKSASRHFRLLHKVLTGLGPLRLLRAQKLDLSVKFRTLKARYLPVRRVYIQSRSSRRRPGWRNGPPATRSAMFDTLFGHVPKDR
jgi:hypothetical protein